MKSKVHYIFFMFVLLAVLVFSSCASKKKAASGDGTDIVEVSEQLKHNKELFDKINSNSLTSEALTSKVKFTVQAGDRSMSVAGQLEMKNDRYIRIRLTPLGLFEAGMIEFTVDHVLILDRMHKEYIKAEYSQVPFLQANGVDFYALQSLFRNTLFVPGAKHIENSSYKNFGLKSIGNDLVLSIRKGSINYNWLADKLKGTINKAEFTYISNSSKSRLDCYYSDFESVAGKPFPHKLTLSFTTNLTKDFSNLMLMVSAKKFKTEQKGSGEITQIPRKYSEKDVMEMLNKILEVK